MKLSIRKIFNIIIAGLSFLLLINTILPYYDAFNTCNLWQFSISFSLFVMFCIFGIIAIYVLNLVNILKEKWVSYVNYAVGFIGLFHISFLFYIIGSGGVSTHVGTWFGAIIAIAIVALSVVRNFMSDEPLNLNKNHAPIKGYDPKTGKPIYAKQKGFDPKTGQPIYEE